MTEVAAAPQPAISRWTLRNLAHPSTLMLLAVNAIPLIGVLAWHWDAFVLLLSYWMETAVIAFWTLVRIAVHPEEATADTESPRPGPVRRILILALVTAVVGLFMAVHFEIIRDAFGKPWGSRAATAAGLMKAILWDTGLWIAVLASFVRRGITCLLDLIDPIIVRRWILAIYPQYPGPLPGERKTAPGAALVGLGGRIVLMQVAVLAGGFFAVKIGMVAPVILPLIILVVIKAYIELSLLIAGFGAAK
jgi:hypothetical protein